VDRTKMKIYVAKGKKSYRGNWSFDIKCWGSVSIFMT